MSRHGNAKIYLEVDFGCLLEGPGVFVIEVRNDSVAKVSREHKQICRGGLNWCWLMYKGSFAGTEIDTAEAVLQ